MTEQEQIDSEHDRNTRRNVFLGWVAYVVLMLCMIFVTIKGCV